MGRSIICPADIPGCPLNMAWTVREMRPCCPQKVAVCIKQNRNRTLVLHFKYQGSTICYQLYILLRGSLNSGNLETTLPHKRCEAALTNDINTSNLSKAELCQIRNGFLSPDSGCNIVQNIHQYNYYFIITLYLYYVST